MNITPKRIPDFLLIVSVVFDDERGFFFKSLNQSAFNAATGLDVNFVQDNRSKSAKNVLRGFFYQLLPKSLGKLVCTNQRLKRASSSTPSRTGRALRSLAPRRSHCEGLD